MTLKPCRECGAPVSTSAKTCPSCGIGKPVKTGGIARWVLVGFGALVVAVAVNSPSTSTTSPSTAHDSAGVSKVKTSSDTVPGITRVGKERAARMWRDIPTTPGMQRWSCSDRTCEVMFDPAMWAQMPYDLKRNVVAMLGIAFAYGRHARYMELHDMMTNRRLARYHTELDDVDID